MASTARRMARYRGSMPLSFTTLAQFARSLRIYAANSSAGINHDNHNEP
jgi:hypothetical protein